MRKYLILACVTVLVISCRKRLDSFLFNPDTSITEYKLDDFDRPEIEVGEEYYIAPSKIYQFTIPLNFEGEVLDIKAIYVGDLSDISQDTVIMYCHGNSGHMDFYWTRQKLLANIGAKNRLGVLMIDYPGFGLSSGSPTEENMYASVNSALGWLKNKGLTDDRLIMYGFSLGTAPTCEIAANSGFEMSPSKIILEAPFGSAEIMVQDAALLNMPSSYFIDVKIDNAEEIKKVNVPLLWIHGTADNFLAIDTHGEIVFNNHPGIKTAVRVSGGGHSNTPLIYGYDNYIDDLEAFIFN